MIFCNGLPKSGTHLLISHLEREGKKQYEYRTVKAYGGWVNKPPKVKLDDSSLLHAHVEAQYDLPGKVYVIFRNPRDCLISCCRYRGKKPIRMMTKYYGSRGFVEAYRNFIPWIEKADKVFYFEELEKTNKSRTYSGQLTNWRDYWTKGVERAWRDAGGLELEKEMGYKNAFSHCL